MKHTMNIGLGILLAFSILLPAAEAQTPAQSSQSSLADYARKVRKDTGSSPAKPKVFDNDNLPKDDKLSVVGQQSAAVSKTAAAEDSSEKTSTPAGDKAIADEKTAAQAKPQTSSDDENVKKQAEWKSWQEKLSAQKDHITLAGRELDVTEREYKLRAAAMYADVGNRMRNATEWDKEEANYKQQIAEKHKALDDAKQKLEDMREEARRAGVPSSMIE